MQGQSEVIHLVDCVLRFGADSPHENLNRADGWADEVLRYLIPRIHDNFTAVDLMVRRDQSQRQSE